jgi:phosphoglycerate-specific signal transduction histidine kinase
MAQALVRKRSEAALQAARSTLARITRLTTMHEVTASIAHEVSQPLAAIVANGDAALRWLQRTPPEVAEVAENVNQIISNAHRASRVVGCDERCCVLRKLVDPQFIPWASTKRFCPSTNPCRRSSS